MYILGINGGVRAGYQDVSAVLLKDGKPIFAIAEERLNRKKHASGQLPYYAIKEAIDFAGISMNEVRYIATHGSTWEEGYTQVLNEYIRYSFGSCPEIVRIHHHLAHAASAYYGSGFEEAMILTIDASGDSISLQKAIGKNGSIEVVGQETRDNSLGIFYSMMTQYCGFTRDTDEYKLMGLAPYGDPTKIDLSTIIQIDDKGFTINPDFCKKVKAGAPQGSRQQAIFNNSLLQLMGQPPRLPHEPISQFYKDVAAAAQEALNQAILAVVRHFYQESRLRKLCLAGGVALNCATNQLLMNLDFMDDIFVQPAAGDDGISLGAAWYVSHQKGITPRQAENYYLGKSFSNESVQKQLDLMQIDYRACEDIAAETAKLVCENKIVGWFQGRDEFGSRALGNRSILANPLMPNVKEILNQKIKFREGYRPFCPSVLEEDRSLYFEGKKKRSPHMTINYDLIAESKIDGISHVNNTARIQTVNSKENPKFYRYLQQLKKEIGVGVSINTSFNRNQEPIVHSPVHALSVFYGSGLDALAIGDFIIKKKEV